MNLRPTPAVVGQANRQYSAAPFRPRRTVFRRVFLCARASGPDQRCEHFNFGSVIETSARNGADLTSRMNRRLHFLPLGGRKYVPSARSYTKREYRRSGLSNEIRTIESGSQRPRSTHPPTARQKAAPTPRSGEPPLLAH